MSKQKPLRIYNVNVNQFFLGFLVAWNTHVFSVYCVLLAEVAEGPIEKKRIFSSYLPRLLLWSNPYFKLSVPSLILFLSFYTICPFFFFNLLLLRIFSSFHLKNKTILTLSSCIFSTFVRGLKYACIHFATLQL